MSTNSEPNITAGLNHKLDLLLRTGCLLVESAADTSRIIRNMKRTAAYLGLAEENLHIYVNYNMLMVNFSDDTHYQNFYEFPKFRIKLLILILLHFNIVRIIY